MNFLDTSWLVKLYVDEADSVAVRSLVRGSDLLVSDLAFVEFHAAVARRQREGPLTAAVAARLLARFRDEWTTLVRVAVSHEVVTRAADLVTRHRLRSLDALHLASALLVDAGSPERVRFGAADAHLVAAATAERLVVLSVTR